MKAVITGIYGQDGSYLCELLLKQGYEVYGLIKNSLSVNSKKIESELKSKGLVFNVYERDLLSYESVKEILEVIEPDEIYHVAASHVGSEDANICSEKSMFEQNVRITNNILDVCYNYLKKCKVITAGSCLMWDATDTIIQTEKTPFQSYSYYGIGKITENMLVKMYRERGLFACTAILYNHESHRRAQGFVTKKIIDNLKKIKRKEISSFTLGNLETKKDWGYAGDYANAMIMMLNQNAPQDMIIATNTLHSIKDFIEECARQLKIENWERYVVLDEKIVTRRLGAQLKGDCALAERELGWVRKVYFENMIEEMIEAE